MLIFMSLQFITFYSFLIRVFDLLEVIILFILSIYLIFTSLQFITFYSSLIRVFELLEFTVSYILFFYYLGIRVT